MEKTERRSKVIVRVEFLDSPHYQKILGIYLKNSGEAKNLVMSAVSSLFLAVALSDYGNATRKELERVARKCRREMLNYISNLDDFFMLKYQINLKSDISSSPSSDEDEDIDDDCKDDDCKVDDCKVEDFNPQVVLDF